MRLPPIAPADLTPEQRSLYDDMREGIAESFKGSSPFATTAPCLGHGTLGCTSLLSAKRAGTLSGRWPTSLRCRSRYGKSRSSSPVRISRRLMSFTPMCSSVSSVACRTRNLRLSSPGSVPSI
jgi:hypothetical protein